MQLRFRGIVNQCTPPIGPPLLHVCIVSCPCDVECDKSMGEVGTTVKAFEQQLQKALANVPRGEVTDQHDAVQLTYVALSRLDNVVVQYSERLATSPLVLAAALIQAGGQLELRNMYSAALQTCYSRVTDLHLTSVQGQSKLDGISYHVQACIKAAVCQAHQVQQDDQQLRRTASVTTMCECLGVCSLQFWRLYAQQQGCMSATVPLYTPT